MGQKIAVNGQAPDQGQGGIQAPLCVGEPEHGPVAQELHQPPVVRRRHGLRLSLADRRELYRHFVSMLLRQLEVPRQVDLWR